MKDIGNINNEMMELSAIWIHKPINGKSRYKEGDLVAIENCKMVEATHATHKIIGTFGNIHNTRLEFLLLNVIDNDLMIFKIR